MQKGVQLRFDDDVMAVVVLNTPSFFENTYKKWLQKQYKSGESMETFMKKIGSNPIRSFFLSRFAQIENVSSASNSIALKLKNRFVR